uniref:Telomerase reverse transcriptase n=1 Tax=Catharus ustulatus TaxID=91951 RepID=A0A8C3UJC5_CATUS
MASWEPFAAVLSALRRCYAEAVPLETFVRRLGGGGAGDAEVLRAADGPGYRTFVGQCLVCVPRGARPIPRPFTFQQLSSQSEVTSRVVQRLCEKKKKNVLAYGYSLPDENSSQFPIVPLSKIHSYLPNTATETLCISGFWETLLSRIGDDVMMYLLEHCAVFMLVPPSNCYQVCGQPVYELISYNVASSLVFFQTKVLKVVVLVCLNILWQAKAIFCRDFGNKPLGSNTEMQADSRRKRVEMRTYESQLPSGQTKSMDGTSKCRGQESPQPHLSNKLPYRLLSSAVYIEKKSLLYSCRSFHECFPKSFILNRLQDSEAGGRRLVEAIFFSQNQWRKKALPKRYRQVRHTFEQLLKNHGKCAYLALLRKNCPIRISEISMRKINLSCQAVLPGEAGVQKQAEHPQGAPQAHSSYWQVYMFVRDCLEKVIPTELWGSNHNKCRFLKNVKMFISRGRFAKISLQELMWRMRVNDCMWLRLGKGTSYIKELSGGVGRGRFTEWFGLK